ncbi:MAG TPA: hypothetical protein ENJ90_12380 [Devosia sp.]|nr:hypothetical protein [Devosia sp.]
MQVVDRRQAIARLRTQIEGIEKRSFPEVRQAQSRPYIIRAPDEKFAPAPAGLLHEVWSDEVRNSGAAFGFALGQARALLGRSRPAILFLQLAHEAQQTGLPYGPGLCHFGLCPEALIIGRVRNVTELLWAAEEAAGCKAVAAIIVDIIHPGKILDFTASRRLAMRAGRGKASVFLLRYGREREAGASHLRWRVAPVSSMEALFDARAPGCPRWQVCLEKGQGMVSDMLGQMRWVLNWTENGFALEQAVGTDKAGKAGVGPALSGPVPTALGYGLSETA